MRVTIDENLLSDSARAWWLSLSPQSRGVFVQALFECEGEPEATTTTATNICLTPARPDAGSVKRPGN